MAGFDRTAGVGLPNALLLSGLLLSLSFSAARAADVDVHGEATADASGVYVQIFADIIAEPLLSHGVALTYDPAVLEVVSAEANGDVWYFGSSAMPYPYPGPDADTAGTIVFTAGKLDIVRPTAGVTGSHVLLGRAEFDRLTPAIPSFTLSLGRGGKYRNFVTVGGVLLDEKPDGVTFGLVRLLPDGDFDRLADAADNCPSIPNGPGLGTCTQGDASDLGNKCSADGDCAPTGGLCSLDQEDGDGDGIGDACECGDVSGDGYLMASDAREIQHCVVGLSPCSPLCDVSGDGRCSTVDARLVQRQAAGGLEKTDLRCAQRNGL